MRDWFASLWKREESLRYWIKNCLVSTGDDETGVEQERRRMEAVIMLSLRCTGHRGELIDDQITRRKKNTKRK
ncbi:unnamed protein product [Brassica rapa subsp. trilocularis]